MLEVMKSCNGQRSLQSAMSITFQWDLGEGSDKGSDNASTKLRMVKERPEVVLTQTQSS